MAISKSDYMLFLRHPAWLWLKKNDPSKLPPVDADLQAIFDTGHKFEQYAEQLFPGGVTLGFSSYDEYKSLPERTTQTLADGADTIFQGRFEYGQLTFICDVIQIVEDNEIDLIEIKSSTSAKVDHEYDLAFQMIVLEGLGYTVRNISVVHVNSDYVRHGDIDATQLTAITDITEAVKEKRELTKRCAEQAVQVSSARTCPDISPVHARLGSYKDWLAIYKSLAGIEEGSIYDLCSIGAKKSSELTGLGITKLIEIPDDFPLSTKQALQLQSTKTNEPIINRAEIKTFLDTLTFPLYFFDYETMSSLVPYFDGMKPYTQYPFQYSLHILDSPDAELRHFEYLHTQNTSPCEGLTEALKTQIGDKGSIITWNMGFEKSCNDRIADMHPEYREFYAALNNRVVDLMTPFMSNWYAHKDFLGSSSLKKVLPVLAPELSYETLGIQEGGAAQRKWMECVLDGKHSEQRDKILDDLKEYCGLDTLAMVEIYKHLREL